jgi:hypothetical protein
MKIKTIIEKAFSTARRRIVGRQKGGVIKRMERMTKARCLTGIDPSTPTANWSWDSAKGVHHINVGTSISLIANASTMLDDKKMKAMVYAVIRHETEHGIQTERTSAASDACIDGGIPFRLLNLFEDCRIEYNSATRPDGDGAFGWRKWQDIQIAYALPTSLLWATKVNEAGIKKSMPSYVPRWMGASTIIYKGAEKSTRLVVLDFYRRIISARTTMSLIPICKEWISMFGTDVADDVITEHSINGKSDPLNETPMMTPSIEKTGSSAPTEDEDHDQNKTLEKWMKREQSMNTDQVGRIASSMSGIINNARTVKNRKSINGTRFNADEAIRGSERAFLSRGRARGKRSVALIVDMSSSMESEWRIHGMKEVVLAFRKLHREGRIDLNLILSQYDRGAKSYRVKDSDPDSWVNSLIPDGGGEEIMASMRRFDGIIKKSTTTVILTDACLSDDDIDISAYRNAGLNAIGAYIEPDNHMTLTGRKRMDKHFARSVIAQEPCELARRLVREMIKD